MDAAMLFLNNQLLELKVRKCSPTLASRAHVLSGWMLPFVRAPISRSIDHQWEEMPTSKTKEENPFVLSFVDPELRTMLRSRIYPSGFTPAMLLNGPASRYGRFDRSATTCLWLEINLLKLCRSRTWLGKSCLVPFGALAWDVLELIPKLKSAVEAYGYFSSLVRATRQYFGSSSSFLFPIALAGTGNRAHDVLPEKMVRAILLSFETVAMAKTRLFQRVHFSCLEWRQESHIAAFP